MDNSAALRAYEDRERAMITDHIRTHGVHLTYVFSGDEAECACCAALGDAAPGAGEGADPIAEQLGGAEGLPPRLQVPFCYSTGLYGIGHPELVVLGLPQDLSMTILNVVAHSVTGHHRDLVPGQLVPDVSIPLLIEELPNPGMVLFQANNYYQRPFLESVPAYQVSWPDEHGRFPGEAGHREAERQPRPGTYRA